MENSNIYHGSNVEVAKPRILLNGFYCTNIEKQAKRWAITRKGASVVNRYIYKPNTNLKMLRFEEMSDEWLDFVTACRKGIDHDYDIVDGPMADDQIWNYVEGFISGKVPRDVFCGLVKSSYPTHQIVFCTEKALSALKFERSYVV